MAIKDKLTAKTGAALVALGLAASLSACGDTLAEQGVLGAGAGTAAAVVLDGNLVAGALVGAAANVAYCKQYPTRC